MLGLVLLLATATAATPQVAQVSVYVSAPIRDGFVDTDKEIQDSIKDLRGKLSGMKEFQMVESPEGADLLITVVTRGVGSEAYGQRLSYSEYFGRYYSNAQLISTPIVAQTLWVSAVLEIGEYRKEFVGTARNIPGVRWGRWSECATNLAKDLKAWAVANREQIKQQRNDTKP
jgi:hypothetical protein